MSPMQILQAADIWINYWVIKNAFELFRSNAIRIEKPMFLIIGRKK